jgi:glycosyltransferase involved in cell wall biosynthesis
MATAQSEPGSAAAGAAPTAPRATVRVASFPAVESEGNPYQRLLYEHLAALGVELVPRARLRIWWLARSRSLVDVLHFHWPESYFLHRSGPRWLRTAASAGKAAAFVATIAAARALGYGVVWTVHQVYPHEPVWRWLERSTLRALARRADALIAHDAWTAERAESELGARAESIEVIPHGSYLAVYPSGRTRAEIRAELGVPAEAVVFLAFGQVRRYKDIGFLLEAFADADTPAAALVVVGEAKDPVAAEAIRRAAESDRRVVARLGFVPEERVAELFDAADAAVCARRDGGTSGSIVLSLSLGLPVIAARLPSYADLVGDDAGWLFEPDRPESLRQVLETVAADPEACRARRAAALCRAEGMTWDDVAARTAPLLAAAARGA